MGLAWYKKNRERHIEKGKEWARNNPDKVRNKQLKYKYGITLDDFNKMLQDQNYSCAICNTKEAGRNGTFNVDHCHQTGKVRALLCHDCNTALGKFKDNPELMRKAASYVEEHKETH